jgi:quinol monooxygenase YgiN
MTAEFGLLVRMEAKAGLGSELGEFLQAACALAVTEQGTVSWHAFKINDAAHGIFDTFDTEAARDAHLGGRITQALAKVAPGLLAADPDVRAIDVLAVK